jgi:hypothetical protein
LIFDEVDPFCGRNIPDTAVLLNRIGLVVEGVDGDQLAVRPQHRAGIAEIPSAAVIAQDDRLAPRDAAVAAAEHQRDDLLLGVGDERGACKTLQAPGIRVQAARVQAGNAP